MYAFSPSVPWLSSSSLPSSFFTLSLRVKLQAFLETSTCYDPACLLTQVEDTDMYRECAVLYGRVDLSHDTQQQLL